jgi:hypothetical protein
MHLLNPVKELIPEYLIFPVILVVVVASGIYAIYVSYKRRKELAVWALKNGLTFSAGKDDCFDSRYPVFDCLQRGDDRYACNVMYGAIAGRVFVGCDYHYVTGSGRSRQAHNISLIIVKSPILLERLLIRPETFVDKFAALAGFDDINFESAEFSRKFYVKSPNKKWAYDIIHPRMMEFLLSMPKFCIQFDLLSVIVYRDCRFSPKDFEAAVSLVNGIFERIPDYIVQDNKIQPR